MRREYAEQGVDRILRGATAVLFIHAPKESRFGAEDANLAYQNASLTAESLGVSQVYMGFVLTAVRQDGKGGLNRMLGLRDRRICAVMALGMPQFRYPNYIDRKEPEVPENLAPQGQSRLCGHPIIYGNALPRQGRFHFPDGRRLFVRLVTYCRTYSDSCRI